MIFLVLLLFAPLQTNQLPTGGSSQQQHQQTVQSNCSDPLHFVAPGTRCKGPADRLTAYLMSTSSVDRSDCPSQSVCLSGAETSACPARLLRFLSDENKCPSWAPLRLLEYYYPQSPVVEVDLQLSAVRCPLRPRCVPLACFNDFCRSKRQRKSDANEADDEDDDNKEAEMASSWIRPALIRRSPGQCDYLQCGCPVTEAVLLAEGCPKRGELLVIQADPINGCPFKLCVNQLPDSLEPLETPVMDTSDSETSNSEEVQDCSNQATDCPPGTSELTVPNPEPGGCPLRICLLPALLEDTAETDPTAETATETAKENLSTTISMDSTDGTTTMTTAATPTTTTTTTTSSNADIFTTNAQQESSTISSQTPAPSPSTPREEVTNPQSATPSQPDSSSFNNTTN